MDSEDYPQDLAQYVMVVDPMEFVMLVDVASEAEYRAIRHDLEGQVTHATREYRRAAQMIQDAVEACPEGHPDREVLERHAGEVLTRAIYLEHLEGSVAGLPPEAHIHNVRLRLEMLGSFGGAPLGDAEVRRRAFHSTKVMGAAAAISGTAALLLVGPVSGAALGVATAVATTRKNHAGIAARKVGGAGVKLIAEAGRLDREHRVSQSAMSAGGSAVEAAREHASQLLGHFGDGHRLLGKLSRRLSHASSSVAGNVSKAMT